MRQTILLLALLSLCCARSCQAKEKKMGWWGETETQCMGRFCLEVPKAMSHGQGGTIQRVRFEEVPWPEPREGAFERVWQAKLDEIAKLSTSIYKPSPGNVTGKMLERKVFKPGVFQGVCYFPDDIKTGAEWWALMDVGASSLQLSSVDGLTKRRAETAASIAEIGAAYRKRKPGEPWPVPGADYFYLQDSLVALPFRIGETAHMDIDGLLDIEFSIKTRTVTNPDNETFMDGLARMFKVMTEAGVSNIPAPAKYGSRTVAGMKGEELFLRDLEKHDISFEWCFNGEAKSERHPEVKIEMEVPLREETLIAAHEKEKKARALWDALLDSMRPAVEWR